jgi:hypothetical protein
MDVLEKEISDLKAKIEKYEFQLDYAIASKDEKKQDLLSGLITSRSETLNRLLDEKKALQTAGTFIYCSNLPLNFISRTTILIIFLSSFDYFLIFSDTIVVIYNV